MGDFRHHGRKMLHQRGQGGSNALRLVDEQRGVGQEREAVQRTALGAGLLERRQRGAHVRGGEEHLATGHHAHMADGRVHRGKFSSNAPGQRDGFLLLVQGEGGQADVVIQPRRLGAVEARRLQRVIPEGDAGPDPPRNNPP